MPTEHTWKNVHNSVTQGNARNPPKCPPGTGIMLRTTKATPQTTRSNTAPQRKRGKVRNVPASGRQVWEGFRKSQSVQGSIDKMLLLTELGLGDPGAGRSGFGGALSGLQKSSFSRSSRPFLGVRAIVFLLLLGYWFPSWAPPHPEHAQGPSCRHHLIGVRASSWQSRGHDTREL